MVGEATGSSSFRKEQGVVVISGDMIREHPSMRDYEAGRTVRVILFA